MTLSGIALKGQSLAEYTLVGGLLALVSIGGLIALNTSVGEQFTTMQGLFGGGGLQANAPQNNQAQTTGSGGQGTVTNTPVANAGTVYPATATGFEQLLADMPRIVETSGASGATKTMMGYLQQVASQLEAAGEITPQQSGLLHELANAGHNSAQLQQALEQYMQTLDPDMTIEAAQQQQLTVNGKQKKLNDWSAELFQRFSNFTSIDAAILDQLSGTDPQSHDLREWRDGRRHLSELTTHNQFLARYNEVQDSGLLSNPTVRTIVNKLATDVVNLNDRVNHLTRFDTGKANALIKDSQSSLKGKGLASTLTHSKSEGICTTGNGQDSGTFCSG